MTTPPESHHVVSTASSLMTLSEKMANSCDHIDRISDLPVNVIDGILEHLNIRGLVRTSILSRKWRYMWISARRLEFDEDFFKRYREIDIPEISRIITQILSLHNGPVYKFILLIPSYWDETITSEDLGTWILFLSRRGIKHLELVVVENAFEPDGVPFDVFSCQELTYLKLGGFDMSVLPDLFGFKSLLVLHLERVTFWSKNDLQSLISGCPLLEELNMLLCFCFGCINFSAPIVKVLRIEVDEDTESIFVENSSNLIDLKLVANRDSASGLIKSLPKIRRLVMLSDHKKILIADMIPLPLLINSFSSLEYLELTAVDLNDRRELLYIVSVIKSAPNLVHLAIESYIDVDYTTQVSDHLSELECIDCCLSQLQRVEIIVKASCHLAMSLIRFILANSPVLETLNFYVDDLGPYLSDAPMLLSISRDLLLMERASQRAGVEFLYDRCRPVNVTSFLHQCNARREFRSYISC